MLQPTVGTDGMGIIVQQIQQFLNILFQGDLCNMKKITFYEGKSG